MMLKVSMNSDDARDTWDEYILLGGHSVQIHLLNVGVPQTISYIRTFLYIASKRNRTLKIAITLKFPFTLSCISSMFNNNNNNNMECSFTLPCNVQQ